MSKLGSRLSALRTIRTQTENGTQNTERPANTHLSPGPGWSETAPLVFERTVTRPCPNIGALHPLLGVSGYPCDSLVFFDLETTGLSGGAGTAVFLAGFGRIRENVLSVKQIFLADFPGQTQFLSACKAELSGEPVVVSYNGKSFDIPLLKSKCLQYGIPFPCRLGHLDLLHISRRLWRGIIGSCSLSDLESSVLGVKRLHDIPGSMIPERYFKFLDSSDNSLLFDIFEHHAQDIHTLALLLRQVDSILLGKSDVSHDEYQLARLLIDSEPERAVSILERLSGEGHSRAAIWAALFYKRAGNTCLEAEYWEKALESGADFLKVTEYAKCLEHKLHDYDKAVSLIKKYIRHKPVLSEIKSIRLARRLARLELKAASGQNEKISD